MDERWKKEAKERVYESYRWEDSSSLTIVELYQRKQSALQMKMNTSVNRVNENQNSTTVNYE